MGIKVVDFYANYLSGSPNVTLVEVPESTPKSTGLVARTDCGKNIAIMSERKVRRPRPGCRYHEFRIR